MHRRQGKRLNGTAKGRKMREFKLADLKPGQEATICSLSENNSGNDRLRELGLIDGTPLRVIKFAPLGDPIEIKVRGFYLSLRKSMARQIRVRLRGNFEN